jgi:hypothetical protein
MIAEISPVSPLEIITIIVFCRIIFIFLCLSGCDCDLLQLNPSAKLMMN